MEDNKLKKSGKIWLNIVLVVNLLYQAEVHNVSGVYIVMVSKGYFY